MNVHCNAGRRTTNLVGDLPGYGTVWYDAKAIANILSLKRVKSKYHVLFDSKLSNVFTVTKPDGTIFKFQESELGLYYLDTNKNMDDIVLINTVSQNKDKYSRIDCDRADLARNLQIRIGRPSTKDFIRIVERNLLPNCPITKADILTANNIYGTEIGALKGKTTRQRPHAVRTFMVPVSSQIMNKYQNVSHCVDIMYINKVPMLITISRHIKFGTIEAIPNKNKITLIQCIQKVMKLYIRGGFKVTYALMDGEFEALRGNLADNGIILNTTARDEHVGDIERYIRTVKERVRAIYNMLPFQRVPARLVIEMTKYSVFWLNAFPHINGISSTMSPRVMITGQTIDFNRHCKYEFGEYVQTHEQHDNSMSPRTIGALALRPTGNAQGSHYFFSLSTGKIINRNHASPLPMPADVIERVHLIALQQKAEPGLIFADRNNSVIDVGDLELHDESSQHSEVNSNIDHWFNDEDEIPDIHFHHNNNVNSNFDDPIQESVNNEQNADYLETIQQEQDEMDQIPGVDNILDNVNLEQGMDNQYETPYNLAPFSSVLSLN